MREVIADQHHVLGPDHPRTLAARQDLVRTVGNVAGRIAAAELLATLHGYCRRALGDEHPLTVRISDDCHNVTANNNPGV